MLQPLTFLNVVQRDVVSVHDVEGCPDQTEAIEYVN